MKRSSIFGQKPWTNPLEKYPFWHFLELQFSGLKITLFYPKYQKIIFTDLISPKKKIRKSLILRQKPWIIFFAKCRCFPFFKSSILDRLIDR